MISHKLKMCENGLRVVVNPTRITVAFDKSTADLLEKISADSTTLTE